MSIERDVQGVVRVPNLHDGNLRGFVVSESDELRLLCTVQPGGMLQIGVPRIRYLRADNVREGNIIFDVKIISGGSVSRDTVEWLLNDDGPAKAEFADKVVRDIERGQWTLLEVTTS